MKKYIIAGCIALALSAVAHAENWIMVMESDNNVRLLVDVDSFGAKNWPSSSDATKQIPWLFAKFMFYTSDGTGDPFLYTTKAESCNNGNGELVLQGWDGKNFATKNRYWWSKDGHKMYDSGGLALCALLKSNASTEPTKQKSAATGKNSV